jgi:hypothetical protein
MPLASSPCRDLADDLGSKEPQSPVSVRCAPTQVTETVNHVVQIVKMWHKMTMAESIHQPRISTGVLFNVLCCFPVISSMVDKKDTITGGCTGLRPLICKHVDTFDTAGEQTTSYCSTRSTE